jgi:sulfhydrogenase subunit beta (sulfur reductase)
MKFLPREALTDWIEHLMDSATLIAPKRVDGILLYQPLASSREAVLDHARPKMSAKEFVFPPAERILSIEKRDGEVTLYDPTPAGRVIFGLRPCDAHGIAVLDTIFLEHEPIDSTYAQRRASTALVGIACPQMWEDCFCNSVGGGPDDPTHLDILLTEVGDGFIVNIVTDKGEELVSDLELQEYTGDTPRPELNQFEQVFEAKDWPERFDDHYWDLLAERCLECRVCAYLCPACRCFDLRDQLVEQGIGYSQHDRLRCWDSCTRPNYRVVAGGHNPRTAKGERLRNRFFCKFYYMPETYGISGCVGCGRCIEACPVNIDILEVLHDVSLAPSNTRNQVISPEVGEGRTA